MTDLAAVVLSLRPVAPAGVPHWTGLAARAWFLEQLSQHDLALTNAIHDSPSLKPYTVSSLIGLGMLRRERPQVRPDRLYRLRLTTLHTDLTRLLLDKLVPKLVGQGLSLTGVPFIIEQATTDTAIDEWAGQTSDAVLIQHLTLQTGPLPKNIELIFDSPTAFRKKGMTMPFPLPDLVFGSLIDRWNAFNAIQLHPDGRRFAEDCIAVGRYRLQSKYVSFEGADQDPVTACLGKCRYVFTQGDRYWRSVIHTLAAYAFYAGVGRDSTIGLGRVRLQPSRQADS